MNLMVHLFGKMGKGIRHKHYPLFLRKTVGFFRIDEGNYKNPIKQPSSPLHQIHMSEGHGIKTAGNQGGFHASSPPFVMVVMLEWL